MRFRIVYMADSGMTVYSVTEKDTISRIDLDTIKKYLTADLTRSVMLRVVEPK